MGNPDCVAWTSPVMAPHGLSGEGSGGIGMPSHRSGGHLCCSTHLLNASAALRAFVSSSPERGERCDFALVWEPMSAEELAETPRQYI